MSYNEGLTPTMIDHVAIKVSDLDRSQRFYTELFGFEEANIDKSRARHIFLKVGPQLFSLIEEPGVKPSGLDHVAFRIADRAAYERAQKELRRRGIVFHGPVKHRDSESLYFSDPDGYTVELTLWS